MASLADMLRNGYDQWLASNAVRPGESTGERTGRYMGEFASEAIPTAVMGALPIAGQFPKAAATLAGVLGLTAPSQAGPGSDKAPSESVAPTADRVQQLLVQRAEADKRRAEAAAERDAQLKGAAGRKPGRGPAFDTMNKEVERLTTEVGALDAMIKEEQKRGSPEFALEMKQKEEAAAEAARIKRASTPTRELISDYTGYIPAATGAAALGLGAMLKGRGISNFNKEIADLSSRWKQAVDRAQAARAGTTAANRATVEAQGLNKEFDALKAAGPGGTKEALEFGAGTGVVGAFAPEEVDFARAVSGSPLWGSLKENVIDDWPSTAKRATIAAGLGMGVGHLGSLAPRPFMSRPMPPGYGPATDALSTPKPPGSGSRAAAPVSPPAQGLPQATAPAPAGPAPAPQGQQTTPTTLSSVLRNSPAPKPKGGTNPDHDWDSAAGRWRDVDGKFLPGKPPAD